MVELEKINKWIATHIQSVVDSSSLEAYKLCDESNQQTK
jgi:hypothetical protein